MQQPKLPDLSLPTIRPPVNIPQVGCPGADGRSYVGEQFGSLPDLEDALHCKHLLKVMADQIFALIQGELPDIPRAVSYAAKAAQLADEVVSITSTLTSVISSAVAEYNDTIDFINQKQAELQAAIAAIPSAGQSATDALALVRYNSYLAELAAQASRLQTSIACISA